MSFNTTVSQLQGALRHLQAAGGSRPVQRAMDILRLAPHLELAEADALLRTPGRSYFIGPPLQIRGAEHVYCLDNTGSPRVMYVGVYRRKESYAAKNNELPDDWQEKNYEYRERAADFAEIYWGDRLQWDTARAHILCNFLWPDRSNSTNTGLQPADIPHVMVSFDKSFLDMGYSDCVPVLAKMHQHFLVASTEIFYILELLGDELPIGAYFCAYCGGGLLETECSHCKRSCVAGMAARAAWSLPIPPPLLEIPAALPRAAFPEDPLHAVKAAYFKWGLDGYKQPETVARGKRYDRAIELRNE